MKPLAISFIAVLLFAAAVEAGQYVVIGDSSIAGQWILKVDANQNVTVQKLDSVILVPTDGGPTNPPPPPPPPPTTLERMVANWSKDVNDAPTAEKLSVGYATVADQIKAGKFATKSQVVKAQQAVNNLLVNSALQGDQWKTDVFNGSVDDWQKFFDKLTSELTQREAQGQMNTVADMEDEWRSIAKGLKTTGGESINWEKLIELIMMIINLIISLQTQEPLP